MKRHQSTTKLILFDLDGTLANSMQTGLIVMNRLRHLFGYGELKTDDPRLRKISGMAFVRDVLGLNILQMLVWSRLFKFLVTREADKIEVYPGWKTVIKRLKKKFRIGIVTSAPQTYTKTILKNSGLVDFDLIVTDVKYHRKDVRLKRILEEEGLAAHDVIYVGDELRDYLACEKHGISFVAVTWGKDHTDVFKPVQKKVLAMINTPARLLNAL